VAGNIKLKDQKAPWGAQSAQDISKKDEKKTCQKEVYPRRLDSCTWDADHDQFHQSDLHSKHHESN